jgi:hypothetical protein
MESAVEAVPEVHRKRKTRKKRMSENNRNKANFIPLFSWARDLVTVRRRYKIVVQLKRPCALTLEVWALLFQDADELTVCGSLGHRRGKMILGHSLLGKNAPKAPFLIRNLSTAAG